MGSFRIISTGLALALGVPLAGPVQAQSFSADARTMWEKMKGSWAQTQGAVKEQWGELTDDDLLAIEGRRDQLIGRIQTRYGISREQAEAQVSAWEQKRARQM